MGGFAVIDSGGAVGLGDMMFYSPDGDPRAAAEIEKKSGRGTLHWVTGCAFYFDGRSLKFYRHETVPITAEDEVGKYNCLI